MPQSQGTHRDLTRAIPIAFDWRKVCLGAAGTALFGVGLGVWVPLATLGRHDLGSLPALLGALEPAGVAAHLVATAVWGLCVFSLFGGGIARLAAIEFCTGRRASLRDGFGFARGRYRAFFWSPTGALLLAGVFLLLSSAGGLLGRVSLLGLGPTLVALFQPISLVFSVVVVSLTVGTLCAWGLMFGAVAVENTDNFDAVSRALNYLYGCPWHAAGYRLAALFYGLVASALALGVGGSIWAASHLAVGLGMGPAHQRLTGLFSEQLGLGGAGAPTNVYSVIYAVVGALYLCGIAGYCVSYLFSSQVIQYLLLRQRNDGPAVTEIALEDPEPEHDLALAAYLFDSELEEEEEGVPSPPVEEDPSRELEGVPGSHP